MSTPLVERIEGLYQRISACGRDPDDVTVVAVTKGFGAEVVQEALAAGLSTFGESYVQELVTKAAELEGAAPEPRWHFVGRLQRNKVRKAAPWVSLWHSVDRTEVGAEIARRSPGADVLVQVNLTGESAKGGCPPSDLATLLPELSDHGLSVRGLMTVGPQGPPSAARPAFTELSRLADHYGLVERSMGMSDDLEMAVQEGATMVRVGSGLFGPRPRRSDGPRPGAAAVGD